MIKMKLNTNLFTFSSTLFAFLIFYLFFTFQLSMFRRVLLDSLPRFLRLLVGWSIGWLVGALLTFLAFFKHFELTAPAQMPQ